MRPVFEERHDLGNHDFEARKIELMKCQDDDCLVYPYDLSPEAMARSGVKASCISTKQRVRRIENGAA